MILNPEPSIIIQGGGTIIAPGRVTFLTRRTIKMLTDKAKDTTYQFSSLPEYEFTPAYGIYLHVPFCFAYCSFCPYYKVILDQEKKNIYLEALLYEIRTRKFSGKAKWLYTGGGTPNTLTIPELSSIIRALKAKVDIPHMGIELIPSECTEEYLKGIKETGFDKISIGVESFSGVVLSKTGRVPSDFRKVKEIINYCHSTGLWVNVDVMIGFENQKIYTFISDIQKLTTIRPNQITVYPVMTIRGTRLNRQTLDSRIQFDLIEQMGSYLTDFGYKRKTLWTFGCDDGLYDSSYDELGSDYIGLGPGGISSTKQWICVNLPLEGYIKNYTEQTRQKVFLNRHVKRSAHEGWRKFGMMLYECRLHIAHYFPFYLNIYILILKLMGYSLGKRLTKKGIRYAHYLTKTIVEAKSFPIQYPGCIGNLSEFMHYTGKSGNKENFHMMEQTTPAQNIKQHRNKNHKSEDDNHKTLAGEVLQLKREVEWLKGEVMSLQKKLKEHNIE